MFIQEVMLTVKGFTIISNIRCTNTSGNAILDTAPWKSRIKAVVQYAKSYVNTHMYTFESEYIRVEVLVRTTYSVGHCEGLLKHVGSGDGS